MNRLEVISGLKTLSVRVDLGFVPIGTKVPFATIDISQPNFSADNIVYIETVDFVFRVYYGAKIDISLQREVKEKLNSMSLPWSSTLTYLNSEHCWEEDFEFSCIGNEESLLENG